MSSVASFRGDGGDFGASTSGYDGGVHIPVSSADDVDPSLGMRLVGCCSRCEVPHLESVATPCRSWRLPSDLRPRDAVRVADPGSRRLSLCK